MHGDGTSQMACARIGQGAKRHLRRVRRQATPAEPAASRVYNRQKNKKKKRGWGSASFAGEVAAFACELQKNHNETIKKMSRLRVLDIQNVSEDLN